MPKAINLADDSMVSWDYADLARIASGAANSAGATFVDTLGYWCPDGQCRIWHGGDPAHPIYWDSQHLTRYGISGYSRFLAENKALRAVVGVN